LRCQTNTAQSTTDSLKEDAEIKAGDDMSNNQTHFTGGVGVSIFNYLVSKKSRNETGDFWEMLVFGLFGGAAATLPDVIDPPLSPTHRNIGHSIVLSGLSIPTMLRKIDESSQINQYQKDFARSILWSYASHLLLDANTPAGVPL